MTLNDAHATLPLFNVEYLRNGTNYCRQQIESDVRLTEMLPLPVTLSDL